MIAFAEGHASKTFKLFCMMAIRLIHVIIVRTTNVQCESLWDWMLKRVGKPCITGRCLPSYKVRYYARCVISSAGMAILK
jgi:hypothetical protein